MALSDQLREKTVAIADRWLAEALAAYPADSAAAFRRGQDRFANPVGHALREGTRAALEALLDGRPPSEVCAALDEVIKIRAVQEFKPSEALRFVFALKAALRAELKSPPADEAVSADLAELDRRIDQAALEAFDIYMRYRSQIGELRINEVKRSVARLVEQIDRWPDRANGQRSPLVPLECGQSQRGDEA